MVVLPEIPWRAPQPPYFTGMAAKPGHSAKRAKAGLQINRLESRPVDETTGVRADQVVWLALTKSIEHYPERFRRVSYKDPESGKALDRKSVV